MLDFALAKYFRLVNTFYKKQEHVGKDQKGIQESVEAVFWR